MGYEVKQYKLTAMDAHSINSARPPNWFAAVKVGDEFPMIIMGKVLLDGEYFHWVDPNATEPATAPVAVAPASVGVVQPMAAPSTPVAVAPVAAPSVESAAVAPAVASSTPAAPPVATAVPVPTGAVTLSPEQHAALSPLALPAPPLTQ